MNNNSVSGFATNTVSRFVIKDDGKLLVHFLITIIICPIASLAAGRTSSWIGRRYTLLFYLVVFFFGSLTTTLARNYAVFLLGRISLPPPLATLKWSLRSTSSSCRPIRLGDSSRLLSMCSRLWEF
ncbi:hypothetical protein TIFTF001_002500 [Ficus carica]|uniref:Uncharacterized protein n=1 Tax=Ficus carica TaxID=3494 RepID=A0AA87ZB52_FICCA|nr:hypothetical protein TIFTF001_002500 [Ficus carica]